jgi:hypothetical protein
VYLLVSILSLFLWFCPCFYDFVTVSMILSLFLLFCPCFYDFVPVAMIVSLFLWFWNCSDDAQFFHFNFVMNINYTLSLLVKITFVFCVQYVNECSSKTISAFFWYFTWQPMGILVFK